MTLRVLYIFSLIFAFNSTFAQNYADSLMLTYVRWQTKDVGGGVIWKSYHFSQNELFGSNQNVNILQTSMKNPAVRFAFATADQQIPEGDTSRKLQNTSILAIQNRALGAVNGTFFNTKKGGSVDFLKINGRVFDKTQIPSSGKRAEHQESAIAISNNKLMILRGGTSLDWDEKLSAENVMVTGPLLLLDGEEQPLKYVAFNQKRHPRTCACVTDDDNVLFVTVDGRNAEAQGMNLYELTFLVKMLGCKDAINLDGGGSTTMYVLGQEERGVVNNPCDNKVFDHLGERPVSNILMMKLR
jgi:exopolysaccharide biosynthesis protein